MRAFKKIVTTTEKPVKLPRTLYEVRGKCGNTLCAYFPDLWGANWYCEKNWADAAGAGALDEYRVIEEITIED